MTPPLRKGILLFNWRDLKNPLAGGAEILTHEVARRWVAQGHEVSLITSRFPGAAEEEVVDGVRILRRGNAWTVYWHARRLYRERFQGRCDVVVDEVNTLPFFTPWYVREPIVMHFNQMAREVWFYECRWWLGWIGYLLEPWWLRLYRRRPVITISESSRWDLITLGFAPDRVTVIPLGIDHAPPPALVPPKAEVPTVIFVGRLKRSKRVDHVLKAFQKVRVVYPNARLWIVGDGDQVYSRRLVALAQRERLDGAVQFFGRVAEDQKQSMMAQAHLIAVTSVREGWGLIVTEANRVGTPAVVYRVPGLVDSTHDGVNGIVTQANTPTALAEALLQLLSNSSRYQILADRAKASAATMTWDRAATTSVEVLRRSCGVTPLPVAEGLGPLTVVLPTSSAYPAQQQTLRQIATMIQGWEAPCECIVFGALAEAQRLATQLRDLGFPQGALRIQPYDPVRGRYCVLPQVVEQCHGAWLLLVDPAIACADGQLARMVEEARQGADFVAVAKAGAPLARPWWFRQLLYQVWEVLVRGLFGLQSADFQTGLKLCRVAALYEVLPRMVNKESAFDLELMAVAHRLGFRVASVPLRLARPLPIGRLSLIAAIRIVLETLAVCYRMHRLRYYDRPFLPLQEAPFVSIVIAVNRWNPYLEECLARCLALQYPAYEVLVLPDEPFETKDPRIRVIPTGRVTPGTKRNRGIQESKGLVIAFLDDDALPTPQWLRNAVRHFADPTIGAVGGPAPTPAHDSWRQQASGAIYGSWMMGGTKAYRYVPYPARSVRDLPTCNLMVRREVLERTGGFDPRFWPGEDTVLCAKIVRDLGQRIWYDPDVLVYHHRRPLWRAHLRQLARYAEHRGYFVKRFPANSLEPVYFIPAALVCVLAVGWLPGVFSSSWWSVYAAVMGIYLALVLLTGLRGLTLRSIGVLTAGIIISNLTYGVFFMRGLLSQRLPEEPC